MRTKILLISFIVLGYCLSSLFLLDQSVIQEIMTKEINPMSLSKRDRMDLAMQQEFEMTKDPALGIVPKDRLITANVYLKSMPQPNGPLTGVDWTERGPDNVGGRTRAIMIDPNDVTKKTVWSAGVAGGLWKTTDITAASPNWQPVDDFFGNLAISSIAFDPSNTNTMYFCTGEGYFNIDAVRGFGVWISVDGGINWGQLSSTTGSIFNYCQKIVVTGSGAVLVATRTGGVQRSINGGTSWTKVLGSGVMGSSNYAFDIEVASNGEVFASLSGSIHKSTNDGASFGSALTIPITADRIELAVAPSDANYAYALIELSSVVNGIIQTTDGGSSWTSKNEPADDDTGIPNTDFSRSQAWYDLTIEVDPNNREILYVGGIDLFKSTNGGNTWTQISHWYGGFGHQEVHADQHIIIFEPGNSNVIYFGNDGGIYRTGDGTSGVPTIARKEFNYNTTQFYACAIHPDALSNHFLGGTQDNGSHKFSTAGINSTIEVTGGDGCFTHIDQNQSQYQWTSYVYNQYRRSTDGGNSFSSINFSSSAGRFINPTDYDNVNNQFYAAWSAGRYLNWTNPQTGGSGTTYLIGAFGGLTVSAVTVSPNTADRVFFGIGNNGRVVRIDNANTAPAATYINNGAGMPAAGYVSSIEVENGNDDHLLVTYSNYGVNSVWETTNGGTNWISVEGNLPDMPIRWALFNPTNSDQALLATELGVWSTDNLDGASTVWGASNTGFANVRTDMLQMRSSDNLVIAATHGRGLYSSDIFTSVTALFGANSTATYIDKSIQFVDASYKATSWSWDFGDSNNSTDQNPVHSYSTAGKFTATLTINSGADTEVKTDYIHILPYGGTPFSLTDGGNFEINLNSFAAENVSGTAFELGNSSVVGKNGTNSGSNVWVTGLVGNYVDNSHTNLYTPVHNFSASGTYTIKFWSRFSTESGWDGFRVEYSLDKGDGWNIVGTTGANWYNYANSSQSTSFPINEPYFTGNNGAWTEYFTDISSLAGNQNVAFRFVFKSDITVTAPGVAIDDFEITGPPNDPFPVELVAFTGSFVEDKVILNWQTTTEVDNYGFEILRQSAWGEQTDEWDVLGFAEGAGNSNSPKHYSFVDENLNGINKASYRLKQIDTDGTFAYSDVIELDINPVQFALEQNYPNPFNPATTIKYSLANQSNVELIIYNSLGEKVEQLVNELQEQSIYTVNWNAAQYASGVYYYSIIATETTTGSVYNVVKKMLLLK